MPRHPVSLTRPGAHRVRGLWSSIGWNQEDDAAGVIKYGVADYEPRKSTAPIRAPVRPALGLAAPVPLSEDEMPLLM